MPSVPEVLSKVNDLVRDTNNSMADIRSVISQGQMISANLLQPANSSFYGFPSNIESVRKAIIMVGYQQISEVIMGLSITQMFDDSQNLPLDLLRPRQQPEKLEAKSA